MKTKLTGLIFGLALIFSSSCLKQGETPKIPGVDGPKINVVNGKIVVSVRLENLELPIGVNLPLSNKLEGANVGVGPAGLESGTLIQATFDTASVNTDFFDVVPSNIMPNGEPFPFLTGGELPSHAFHVPKALDMTFYASKKVFGFFLPIKLGSNVTFDVPFRLKIGGQNVGIISAIGNNSEGEGSGIMVLLTLKDIQANDDIQTALKYSKKSKYRNKVF